jgi:hypothetical protein
MLKIILVILVLFVTACDLNDGIPEISDPKNIMVDDQAMTAEAFYSQYCTLKPTHDTCIAVGQAAQVESRLQSTRKKTTPDF